VLPSFRAAALLFLCGATSPAVTRGDEFPAAAAEAKERFSEEILVIGSRVRRKDLTTPAPVTVVTREEILASGKVSLGEFLQSLPEQGNARNTQFNSGGDGSTRVSLRGLGERDQARKVVERLLRLWDRADPDLPLLTEARALHRRVASDPR